MTYSDMIVFGFAVLNIGRNASRIKKDPISSIIFGLLWTGLATAVALGIKIP